jgi:myo-inositol-1(or 4)-monophosphatase
MTLDPAALDEFTAAAEKAARIGGAIVLEHFGGARHVRAKAPGDYVSEVDLASEAAIRDELERLAPGIPFFGEEGGGDRAALGWLVDPLDGTANFLHGFPVVGVSVALVEDGRPAAGVVHAPMLATTFRCARGRGAWQDGERITVSTREPAQAICATGFPFKAKQRRRQYMPVFAGAFDAFEDLRRAGAASLDLAWVAAGVFDGFFEVGLGPWDVAAGALLIEEAGGVVTDWSGDTTSWLATGDILCGSHAVHATLRTLVDACDEVHTKKR